MQYFYKNVPGLGHVAVSRHAQSQMEKIGISQSEFEAALLKPTTGAKLVKTVYRIKPQANTLLCR